MMGQLWEVDQVFPEGQVLRALEGEVGILAEWVDGSGRPSGGTGLPGSLVSSACRWKWHGDHWWERTLGAPEVVQEEEEERTLSTRTQRGGMEMMPTADPLRRYMPVCKLPWPFLGLVLHLWAWLEHPSWGHCCSTQTVQEICGTHYKCQRCHLMKKQKKVGANSSLLNYSWSPPKLMAVFRQRQKTTH